MTYDVRLTTRAECELEEAYLWYRGTAGRVVADHWYNGFIDAFLTLEGSPTSFPLIPEPVESEGELRELLYGRERNWRAIFVVRGSTVLVLHIRHAARRPLTPGDL